MPSLFSWLDASKIYPKNVQAFRDLNLKVKQWREITSKTGKSEYGEIKEIPWKAQKVGQKKQPNTPIFWPDFYH